MFPLIVYFVFLLIGFSEANCGDDILLNIGRVDNDFYLWTSSWQTQDGTIKENLEVGSAESHGHVITKGFTYHPMKEVYPSGYTFNGEFTVALKVASFGTQYTAFYNGEYIKGYARHQKQYLDWRDGYYHVGAAVSVHTQHSIYSTSIIISSDERIKRDIVSVPQNLSLDIVRRLDTKYYKYVDEYLRGPNRTIGFIAQDVLGVIPEAVNTIRNFIPDEMRIVNASFNNKQMTLAETLEPGTYRFFMMSDSDPSQSQYDLETKDGSTFNVSFTGHKRVFLYGSLAEDFLTINKDKIFSVAYAALRQIDENQQRLEKQIEEQERRIENIKTRLSVLN